MGYFRDKFFVAFKIKSDNIKSLDNILSKIYEKRKTLEEKYNILLKRLPIYANEENYIDKIEIIQTEEFRFLPLGFVYRVTLREYLDSLKKEGKINLAAYMILLSTISEDKLERTVFYSYLDTVIYEGSNLYIVINPKYMDNVETYLSAILGSYKKSFLTLDNIHDFILWIIHKHYTKQRIGNLSISDVTFQRRIEAGIKKLKKIYDHKGPNLIYSDEVLLGIAKAFKEFNKAAKIRVNYGMKDLEFYIEDRSGLLFFYPILKGYDLNRDEKEKYNSIYRKIKAIYELIYNILPILAKEYKNDKKWPMQREQLIREANDKLRKRLETMAVS